MIIKDKKLTVDTGDLNHLIRVCVSQYMFRNKNAIPEVIVVEVPAEFRFKYDISSMEQTVPIQVVCKEKAHDTTDGHSGTRGNRKTSKPVTTDSKNKPESD